MWVLRKPAKQAVEVSRRSNAALSVQRAFFGCSSAVLSLHQLRHLYCIAPQQRM
jgi:hypothetical protein